MAALPEEIDAGFVVVRHQGSIQSRIVVRAASPDHRQRVSDLGRVAQRLFRNDIDRARNCRRTEKSGTAATHDLDTLDHISRNLFETIHTRQRTEYGTAIHQYLRVRTFQPIDTHLLETAVLTIVFHPYARLEVQSVGKRSGMRRLEHFRIQYVYKRRSHTAGRLVPVSRNHDSIQRQSFFFRLEIDFQRFSLFQCHGCFDRFITHRLHHDRERSFRQVLQIIMPCGVGRSPNRRPFQKDRNKRQMLSGFPIHHMADNIRVRWIQGRISLRTRNRKGTAQAYYKCNNLIHSRLF